MKVAIAILISFLFGATATYGTLAWHERTQDTGEAAVGTPAESFDAAIGNAELVHYEHPEYGFSFDYPATSHLYDESSNRLGVHPHGWWSGVQVPNLVVIELPETHLRLRGQGFLHYFIIVSDEGYAGDTVGSQYQDAIEPYRKKYEKVGKIFNLRLEGIRLSPSGGIEPPPVAVVNAFDTVVGSFQLD